MQDNIKIGLIGCGPQSRKHIAGLKKAPGVELVLADPNADLAAEAAEAEGLTAVRRPDDLFEDPAVTAVDICTPTHTHFDLIQKAVHSGRHFFCEKPLCETLSEAQTISDLVGRTGQVGMVGYIYRFCPVFEIARQLFRDMPRWGVSLELGRVTSALFRLGGRGSQEVWKHSRESGGGAVNEMLVHLIDLAIWFFGPVKKIDVMACDLVRPTRVIRNKTVPADAEDYVLIRAHMKSGVQALLQADLLTPAFHQLVEIQGENGTFMGSIQPDMPNFLYLETDVGGYQKGKTAFDLGQRNLFEAQMAEFVSAVKTPRQPSRCTIHDSLLLMEALELMKVPNVNRG